MKKSGRSTSKLLIPQGIFSPFILTLLKTNLPKKPWLAAPHLPPLPLRLYPCLNKLLLYFLDKSRNVAQVVCGKMEELNLIYSE